MVRSKQEGEMGRTLGKSNHAIFGGAIKVLLRHSWHLPRRFRPGKCSRGAGGLTRWFFLLLATVQGNNS